MRSGDFKMILSFNKNEGALGISRNSYTALSDIVKLCKQYFNITAKRKLERLQFQLHHRLSKFEVPVVVNLKHIFELFGLYTTCFLI
jgi:hypothetical protein